MYFRYHLKILTVNTWAIYIDTEIKAAALVGIFLRFAFIPSWVGRELSALLDSFCNYEIGIDSPFSHCVEYVVRRHQL